jgi:hypothetical protein
MEIKIHIFTIIRILDFLNRKNTTSKCSKSNKHLIVIVLNINIVIYLKNSNNDGQQF